VTEPRGLWPVLFAYVLAFVAIVVFSVAAVGAARSLYPDLPDALFLESLPALLAGSLASSTALILTVLVASRPLTPAALRLLPGRETGRALAVMVVGILALGQALDSLLILTGLANRGSMVTIRRALEGAVGPELFGAVVVIGLLAGVAEEVFFRGLIQARLRQRWRPALAIAVTSVGFGLFHLDWLHSVVAVIIGVYLGFITELSGSALPAIVCHVVTNVLFTLLTATLGVVPATLPNLALLGTCSVVVVACLVWLRRALPAVSA
jgi:hypothetical protein